MRLLSLHIKGFRGVRELSLEFSPALTVIVGENGAGKSTAGHAVAKLLSGLSSSLSASFNAADFPYQQPGEISIAGTLDLTEDEVRRFLIAPLVAGLDTQGTDRVSTWLTTMGREIRLRLAGSTGNTVTFASWGSLNIAANKMSTAPLGKPNGGGQEWRAKTQRAVLTRLEAGRSPLDQLAEPTILEEQPAASMMSVLGAYLVGQFKLTPEFRGRTPPGSRGGGIETWGGEELASVLLNLRTHADPTVSARYEEVKRVFAIVMPQYAIEAVQQQPGEPAPDVRFHEERSGKLLPLGAVSAGTYQILSMVTNIVGRRDLVVFLEQPEQYLHPHAMRFLESLIREHSSDNQFILTTHSPFFVPSEHPESIVRMWRSSEGTKVQSLGTLPLTERQWGQVRTALRRLSNREVVFARSVILLEEETTEAFLREIAPRLDIDLNAGGISIVQYEGDAGFRPFRALLDALEIPHVNLRDPTWGINPDFPPGRFFSFEADSGQRSFEEYMMAHGFTDLIRSVKADVGLSKPRIAAELGRRINPGDIPEIFRKVVGTALELAERSSYI